MEKRAITTIVFDLGNVLIPFDHSLWIKNYNSIEPGLGERYFERFVNHNQFNIDYESGRISDEEFISMHLDWLEKKVSKQKFIEIFSNIFSNTDNISRLLPKLKQNYKLYVLSNTSFLHQEYGWGNYDFLKYFDGMILSYEVGTYKPEDKIYREVEQISKEVPQNHIFIDDMAVNVKAAKNLGWDGIHFLGYKSLIEELKLRNILL
jgi:putative hydrolase of the HAD superfamily